MLPTMNNKNNREQDEERCSRATLDHTIARTTTTRTLKISSTIAIILKLYIKYTLILIYNKYIRSIVCFFFVQNNNNNKREQEQSLTKRSVS